ncbi:MAG: hypothetical protein Hals2KO_35210 [Halioglobus sp.]
MTKYFTLVFFILHASAYAYEGSPASQVDSFFSELSTGKTQSAIENLYASNPAMKQKAQDLAILTRQIGTVSAIYGALMASEKITEENISPSIVRIVMVAKHELHPVIWEFYFYRPKKEWIISQALFVDQFQVIGSRK